MKTMVIGGGAREHALVAALARDPECGELVCVPGNAGIASEPGARCVAGDVGDPRALLALAEAEAVDFTVVGPELPLARGVADAFAAAGRELFGPTGAAARLESSKAFAKAFMQRHGIPTARHAVCTSEQEACDAVAGDRFGFPVVVKADGLAAGKGVTVAADRTAAVAAVREAMVARRFGDAGSRVVIEECLAGPEVSFFVVSDGRRALPLPAAQDYKRVSDGDRGPNTGGMGAFAPTPLLTPDLERQVMREIVTPAIEGMRADGHEYRGVLYVGLMLTSAGPRVIEFNVRFGDPEAQVVLPMIESGLAGALRAAARGNLNGVSWRVTGDPHVGVVVASGGYPGAYTAGRVIAGLDAAADVPGVRIVHAGTRRQDGEVVTSGGRVLTVVARGGSFGQAIDRAYEAVDRISFDGSFARRDIGRAVREGRRQAGAGMANRRVQILMGSDSDAGVMRRAVEVLDDLGVPSHMTVASAHRSPERVRRLIDEAPAGGVGVFIVGAGAAAHLAGVVAAHSTLPVIGVPIDSSPLQGWDALLATVQMPPGVPVATVSVGKAGAVNAAVLAAQILATGDAGLAERLADYKRRLADKVEQAAARVEGPAEGGGAS